MSFKNNSTIQSHSPSIWRTAAGSVIALLLFLAPLSARAYEIIPGTGNVGSFSYFSGRMLCRTISRQLPDITCLAQASDDKIDTLRNGAQIT
ncbi:MAG: hypothetical protein U9R57_09945 [Thermodesulfobacteriota bacterium]|nr:hypothetical protein [Thermodesulfobacteriota bacterium]